MLEEKIGFTFTNPNYEALKVCKKLNLPVFSFEIEIILILILISSSSTVNEEEISKFDELSKEWWQRDGPLKALHSMNGLRIPMIRDNLISKGEYKITPKPLSSLRIMDVGCGGGILSEPLNRLGAIVTGVDASEGNIGVAKAHLKNNPSIDIEYLSCSIESLVEERKETYDALVASEVVEHVNDLPMFIKACCQLIKVC